MNKFKKAMSVGVSAALLASLFTAVVAGPVAASVTATSAGTFAPGTTSPNAMTLTFVERAATTPDGLPAGAGSLTVTINDADGGNVTFSGTPSTAGTTGSLGASASTAGNVLTVSWTASDTLNVETIVIGGLKIAADSTALAGPVVATLGGTFAPFFAPSATSTTTATGVIQDTNTLTSGADVADVLLSSVCAFQVTAADPVNSLASFSDAADARAVTAVAGAVLGVQAVTFAAGTAAHPAGTVVTQTVSQTVCGVATIPTAVGVIANALAYTSPQGNLNVFPGENNQLAGYLQFVEPSIGFLADGTTITLHITTAGVTFSYPPSVTTTSGTVVAAAPLSADRTSATVTMSTASVAPATIVVNNIHYDVASTVASGTTVSVTATVSSGKLVNPASRTNAVVGRVFNASAPTPNVNIGQNGQTAGLITITEVAAGSFTDGTGANNVFEVCPDLTASFTSPGPSAFVTGGVAAGNLILRSGAAASTTNIVAGTPDPAHFGCYYWTVWTASTTASTITIGSSATVGPLVNVNTGFPPGALNAILYVGALATIQNNQGVTLAIANRVFPGQVKVTAVSQPVMAPGSSNQLAGNILIQETGNGQLKLGTTICVEIVPNQNTGTLTDVFLSALTTADLPVATAANGVVIGAVSMSSNGCSGLQIKAIGGSLLRSFRFTITQQSTTGNGSVKITNLHYNVLNDAVTGPVQVDVFGYSVGGASIDFQSIISNAKIGSVLTGTAATRLGVTQVGAFTTSTKVQKVGMYVTYRFDFGVAAAGAHVDIWAATKTGNDWTGFSKITSRIANASGVVYYYIRQSSATWKSYRAMWAGGGAFTPARQARWIP